MAASKLSGSLSGVDGSALTGIVTDTSVIQDNIAMIGFKIASNNSLTRYNMVDQVIDEYQDATGVDASASTGEVAGGTGTGKYYYGWAAAVAGGYETGDRTASITVTHNGLTFTESQPGSNLVDGLNADQYQSGSRFVFANATPSAGAYIRFTHTVARTFNEAKWYGCTSATGVWKWQGSNDGSTFTDIGSSFTLQSDSGWQTAIADTLMTMTSLSANTTAYTIYQLTWVSGATYGGDFQAECEFKTATSAEVTGMDLISTSNTASTAPTTGDLVLLVDDAYTASTINTDIKGYVSRDGGTGWDQTTLVDQGTWGSTNKKILSAHDVAFSNSASGTDMKYKIETANQSYTAGYTLPQGYAGGNAFSDSAAGGGGGAGSVGVDVPPGGGAAGTGHGGTGFANGCGGNGGDGIANDITGTSLFYAGGGGGTGGNIEANNDKGGAGGSGVGGNGSEWGVVANGNINSTAGAVNTGSGGGGTGSGGAGPANGTPTLSGHGGSGIVVIRALTSETSGSTGNWDTTGTVGSYTWYKWTTVTSAGTFTASQAANYEYLVVAGGGAGGAHQTTFAGGGGAGGYRAHSIFSVTGTISGITVGAGGTQTANAVGGSGANSVFSTITATGGGGGGWGNNNQPTTGGSGGGSTGRNGSDQFGAAGNVGGDNTPVGATGKETRIHATSLAWA
jgi:hypothetical protein